jgi:hypothetical protein
MKSRLIIVVMAVATAACNANGSKTVPADAALASTGGGAATGGVRHAMVPEF